MISKRLTLIRQLRSPAGIQSVHKEIETLQPPWGYNETLFLWQALWGVGKRTVPAISPNQQFSNLMSEGAVVFPTYIVPKPGDLYVEEPSGAIGIILSSASYPKHLIVVNNKTPRPAKKELTNVQFFLRIFT